MKTTHLWCNSNVFSNIPSYPKEPGRLPVKKTNITIWNTPWLKHHTSNKRTSGGLLVKVLFVWSVLPDLEDLWFYFPVTWRPPFAFIIATTATTQQENVSMNRNNRFGCQLGYIYSLCDGMCTKVLPGKEGQMRDDTYLCSILILNTSCYMSIYLFS